MGFLGVPMGVTTSNGVFGGQKKPIKTQVDSKKHQTRRLGFCGGFPKA